MCQNYFITGLHLWNSLLLTIWDMRCIYILLFSPNLNWKFLHQVNVSSSLDACCLIFRGREAAENHLFWLHVGIQKPLLKASKVSGFRATLFKIQKNATPESDEFQPFSRFVKSSAGCDWQLCWLDTSPRISGSSWAWLGVCRALLFLALLPGHTQALTCSLPGCSLLTLPFSQAAPRQHSCLKPAPLFPFLLPRCAFDRQVLSFFPEKRFRPLLSPFLASLCHTKRPLRDFRIYFGQARLQLIFALRACLL